MGLDGTIKRADGKPLGPIKDVQEALAAAFPGIILGRLPSGANKIRKAAEMGIEFPEVIRNALEATPVRHGGDYSGPRFSAQFVLGASDTVDHVDVVLYGNTVASEPMFAQLREQFGWETTHP
jgi:hypothetical protein